MINNIVDVEQNEIDRKDVEFEFSEVDIKIEFATKRIFDLIIDSKHDIVDIELKLIVNFSDLKNLKDLILIFNSELTMTSTTMIFCSITF